MDLHLEFAKGVVTGESLEPASGIVRIVGTYHTDILEVRMTLHFEDPADLDDFRGFREGKGIWGTFACRKYGCRGGFQIWPVAPGEGAEEALEAEAPSELTTSTRPL